MQLAKQATPMMPDTSLQTLVYACAVARREGRCVVCVVWAVMSTCLAPDCPWVGGMWGCTDAHDWNPAVPKMERRSRVTRLKRSLPPAIFNNCTSSCEHRG